MKTDTIAIGIEDDGDGAGATLEGTHLERNAMSAEVVDGGMEVLDFEDEAGAGISRGLAIFPTGGDGEDMGADLVFQPAKWGVQRTIDDGRRRKAEDALVEVAGALEILDRVADEGEGSDLHGWSGAGVSIISKRSTVPPVS